MSPPAPEASDGLLLRRLKWRCRRGTRELDALLTGWLDRHAAADPAALQSFDALLDRQDPELWDWLMGHAEPPRADWGAILDEIRQRAGLAS
ncbi:MAG TPA: succinate dehydrogenase assembly factor 2 [Rhodanobacteraceae bacterium]|nr:succinate dehydrogenase assembly factor 2 [Rhodanobacteraceae bacterium]